MSLILKMKFDQDLCLNLLYDIGKMNSTLGSVVPLAMFKLPLETAWRVASCERRKQSNLGLTPT